MNNCVGFGNYRYFLLFVIYLFAGCLFVLFTAMIPWLTEGKEPSLYVPRRRVLWVIEARPGSAVFFQVVLAFSASVALSLFALWHIYLTFTAQTTLEFYTNIAERRESKRLGKSWRNPFDKGMYANFEDVLLAQPCGLAWLLPSTRRPAGTGMEWFASREDGLVSRV